MSYQKEEIQTLPFNDSRSVNLRKWNDLVSNENFSVIYEAIDRRIKILTNEIKRISKSGSRGLDETIQVGALQDRIDELEKMKRLPKIKQKAFLLSKEQAKGE